MPFHLRAGARERTPLSTVGNVDRRTAKGRHQTVRGHPLQNHVPGSPEWFASKSRSLHLFLIQPMGCRRDWKVLLFNLMVEKRISVVDDRKLNAVFSALSDPTRRAIVRRLAAGEASVGELAEPFHMSFQAVSKHLQVLEYSGLIERSRRAQQRPCRLRPDALEYASGWLGDYRQLWETAFDRLDEHLTKKKGSPK
jgi:DNA-binding transcriptional ArsR family regulator